MIQNAPFACIASLSKGRKYNEDENPNEIFLRDREKVIHSYAFRRLEYKTQVFVNHVGDHYRTRLTHSIEVSQIAKIVSRKLNLNEDLAETVALSHDLGHPPFGHAGEEGLNLAARDYGGFDHNAHTIKIVVNIEQLYSNFNGLNLTYETLEGIAKHNGPITYNNSQPHSIIPKLLSGMSINFSYQPSLEAQCAALADDIAYINHDLDDGLRASMFQMDDLLSLPLIKDILITLKKINGDDPKNKHELIRQLSKLMIEDLVSQTLKNLSHYRINNYQDVIKQTIPLVTFSEEISSAKEILKQFLMEKVYRNYRVNRMSRKAKNLINDLFIRYLQNPNCLPTEWYARIVNKNDNNEIAICIIDYIAGMTDRYAIEEYKRLFDPNLF